MPNLHFLEDFKTLKPGDLIPVSKSSLDVSHQICPDMIIRLGVWADNNSSITAISSIEAINTDTVSLRIKELIEVPTLPQVNLILGVCRPQMLKRVLETLACFKVNNLYLVRTEKTPKSYLQSKVLRDENLDNYLKIGSMQAGFAFKTQVLILKNLLELFKLKEVKSVKNKFLAECSSEKSILNSIDELKSDLTKGFNIAVGPESGWSVNELELFQKHQYCVINLAPSILRVDVAVISALAQCTSLINC